MCVWGGGGCFSLNGFLLEDFWRNGQLIEFLFLQLVEPVTASFPTNTEKCISCQLGGYQPKWKSSWRVPSLHNVADIMLIRTLLTPDPFQGCVQCSWGLVPAQWSLWEGSKASPPPKTGLFYPLFRMKAFRRSMLQIHMLLGDIWCLQYLITCLDNLSDSSLIPLAPKIAQGFYLSVFYFLAQEIMKPTRAMLE